MLNRDRLNDIIFAIFALICGFLLTIFTVYEIVKFFNGTSDIPISGIILSLISDIMIFVGSVVLFLNKPQERNISPPMLLFDPDFKFREMIRIRDKKNKKYYGIMTSDGGRYAISRDDIDIERFEKRVESHGIIIHNEIYVDDIMKFIDNEATNTQSLELNIMQQRQQKVN